MINGDRPSGNIHVVDPLRSNTAVGDAVGFFEFVTAAAMNAVGGVDID